jgi:hypothetical protein
VRSGRALKELKQKIESARAGRLSAPRFALVAGLTTGLEIFPCFSVKMKRVFFLTVLLNVV